MTIKKRKCKRVFRYYCCKSYPGGLPSFVEEIRPLIKNKLAKEGLEKIKAKFATVKSIGPVWVADFLEISDSEERARVRREAFELIDALMNELGIEPFSE